MDLGSRSRRELDKSQHTRVRHQHFQRGKTGFGRHDSSSPKGTFEKRNCFIQVAVKKTCPWGYLQAICGPHSPEGHILSLRLTDTALVSQGGHHWILFLKSGPRGAPLMGVTHPSNGYRWYQVSREMEEAVLRALRTADTVGKYLAIKTHHKAHANSCHPLPHHHYTLVRTAPLTGLNGKTGWTTSSKCRKESTSTLCFKTWVLL